MSYVNRSKSTLIPPSTHTTRSPGVTARSTATRQSRKKLDCHAPLAMTSGSGLVRRRAGAHPFPTPQTLQLQSCSIGKGSDPFDRYGLRLVRRQVGHPPSTHNQPSPSLRGAQRRGSPGLVQQLDCHAPLAMTSGLRLVSSTGGHTPNSELVTTDQELTHMPE